MIHETDPLRRFSNRVADYVKYRPGYPPQLLDCFRDVTGLDDTWRIADIGSGTGKLAALFLDRNTVFSVEPNAEMRAAGEQLIGAQPNFRSIAGSAEETTLDRASVRLITAAQAFHWFDPAAARAEFLRILEPGGWIALVWNTRRTDATPFMRAYDELLLRHAIDYASVDHRRVDTAALESFLGRFTTRRLAFTEMLDFDTACGRMRSASYVPAAGQPGHDALVAELRTIFDRCQENGRVAFVYDTDAYFFGPVSAGKSAK